MHPNPNAMTKCQYEIAKETWNNVGARRVLWNADVIITPAISVGPRLVQPNLRNVMILKWIDRKGEARKRRSKEHIYLWKLL